jgi:hypothetical protein
MLLWDPVVVHVCILDVLCGDPAVHVYSLPFLHSVGHGSAVAGACSAAAGSASREATASTRFNEFKCMLNPPAMLDHLGIR